MKKQYIRSERAHYMCPNMHFGMAFKISDKFDETKFDSTMQQLADAHPFLKAIISYDPGSDDIYYNVTSESKIIVHIEKGQFDLNEYDKKMKDHWDILEEGLLKVFVYDNADEFEIVLMAHHLLTDGTGLLQLMQEIADCYVDGKKPEYVEEQLIESIADLPAGSELSGISKFLVNRANKQWKKEKHKVTYDTYYNFTLNYNASHKLEYVRYDVDDSEYQQMKAVCKENNITINDLLMAKMYIKSGARKIIIAADLRNKLSVYNKGALGNYATAMGIECKSKTIDEVEKAKEVHKIVLNTMNDNKKLMLVLACYFQMEPTLLDAAAISGLGGFESKAASFVGGGMFGFAKASSYSITNLGKIENKNIKSAMFIPPASPAAILTLGVVTVNDKMCGCTSRSI